MTRPARSRYILLILCAALVSFLPLSVWMIAGQSQTRGRAALESFQQWKEKPENAKLKWNEALERYRSKLNSDGMDDAAAESVIRLVVAYDEAELYDQIYSGQPKFNTEPNEFLVRAVEGIVPGDALDVGMGQGRNSIYLARKGWKVTGFDVSEVGVRKARAEAARLGLSINAVHAADEEFDFGKNRWDLIAIIYAIEKHSVYRVRDALKPGGVVVVVASHIAPGGYPFGYESGELRGIFEGFRILKYEEKLGVPDFDNGRNAREPLVGLIAQKPR